MAMAARRALLGAAASGCGPPAPQSLIIAATATANEPEPGALGRCPADAALRGGHQHPGPGLCSRARRRAAGRDAPHPAPGRRPGRTRPPRSQILDGNVTAVQRLVAREAARGPFDLLTTIAMAARAVAPPATLIVVSSGLSTAGGLDMRQVGWDASPRWSPPS